MSKAFNETVVYLNKNIVVGNFILNFRGYYEDMITLSIEKNRGVSEHVIQEFDSDVSSFFIGVKFLIIKIDIYDINLGNLNLNFECFKKVGLLNFYESSNIKTITFHPKIKKLSLFFEQYEHKTIINVLKSVINLRKVEIKNIKLGKDHSISYFHIYELEKVIKDSRIEPFKIEGELIWPLFVDEDGEIKFYFKYDAPRLFPITKVVSYMGNNFYENWERFGNGIKIDYKKCIYDVGISELREMTSEDILRLTPTKKVEDLSDEFEI